MKPELLILRHGKADRSIEADEFRRPLKERGKRAAQRMGVWLLEQGVVPDHVVSSPAERALATAEKACKAMGEGEWLIQQDQRLYGADPGKMLDLIRELPATARRAMIVGHSPGLESLLGYMLEEHVPLPKGGRLLPQAALARLSLDCEWGEVDRHCAHLLSITRPKDLPKKFPFPGPGGDELRERPAYYYTQSSVIPYRIRDGRPEILVVCSRRKKHLVVPKGIVEPGLSPRESAAREAVEEAGVEGEVGRDPLGSYSYGKWGAACSVDVFPMEVSRVLPEEQWEEHHRGRKWVSAKCAIRGLEQKQLATMVRKLVEQLSG